MKMLRTGLTAVALALSFAGVSQAAPVWSAGTNLVKYINYENEYRPLDGTGAFGTCTDCLPTTAGDPPGYARINPAVANNTKLGDIFLGVLSLTSTFDTAGQIYFPVPGNLFTGYFVQKVSTFAVDGSGNVTLGLSSTTDPFGILEPGGKAMFQLYSNTAAFSTTGTAGDAFNVTASIASATSGTKWASLYDPTGIDGYAYTLTTTGTINNSNTNSYAALDILTKYSGYNAGALNKINSQDEDAVGGVIANPGGLVCSSAEIGSPSISCTDIVGKSNIAPNTQFGQTFAGSPWMFQSQDPFYINKIPEPGSLALMGAALAGLAVVRRRKSA